MASVLESIRYVRGGDFEVLDQLRVPQEAVFRRIGDVSDAVDAIKLMQVRGAPLIAIVGCLGIGTELSKKVPGDRAQFIDFIKTSVHRLVDARPTAVNMRKEGARLVQFTVGQDSEDVAVLTNRVLDWIDELVRVDLETNKGIGDHGANAILQGAGGGRVNVLTHCNTGSLATSGYGTALGVVRSIHQRQLLDRAYFTETRPYNQGSRLTSFELLHDTIPSTMVCDSAVSWLMATKKIHAVVVGADRVVRNGDTANKIGTYQLALVAKAHGVPFYVAAPFSTIDGTIDSGKGIVIEERPASEVTSIAGVPISPQGIDVWNPAFDVTPADLITGIITERRVFTPSELTAYLDDNKAS